MFVPLSQEDLRVAGVAAAKHDPDALRRMARHYSEAARGEGSGLQFRRLAACACVAAIRAQEFWVLVNGHWRKKDKGEVLRPPFRPERKYRGRFTR